MKNKLKLFGEFMELTLGFLIIFIAVGTILAFYNESEAREIRYICTEYDELSTLTDATHIELMEQYKVAPELQMEILNSVIYASDEYGISQDIIMSIIAVESSFKPNSKSHVGAQGLMQVMYPVWGKALRDRGIINNQKDLYKVHNNIMAGAYVLHVYLKEGATKYNDEQNIIKHALFRYLGITKVSINMEYYNKVLAVLGRYHINKGLIDTAFYEESTMR